MSAFLSFVGGASRQFVSSVEQAEIDAKEMAKNSFKNLTERYDENTKANRDLTNKMAAEKQYIETVWPNATPEQINELVANPVALEAIKKVKNPQSVSLNNYIQVIKGNESKAVGAERAAALPEITQKVKEAMQPAKGGSPIGRFIKDIGQERFESDMQRQALGSGIDLEQLRKTERANRPAGSATFDMSVLEPAKKFEERTNDAQVNMLDALKSNDPTKIEAAKKELTLITKVKSEMTPAQTEFANKVADIKNRYMFGTPEERKAAKPEYDKLMSDIRAEAQAKKVGEGDGEGKIPALSTLNTFTSAAVARAVAAKHGDLIRSKQLAIVEKADGSVGIDYIGDNDTLRRQILETQANAARNALSLYTDAQGKPFNRDVASVLNSFTSVVPSVVRTDGATPAAEQQPAAKPAATTPAPKTKAEYDAIPKGTRYIDTDGKTKIKG